MRLPCPVTRSSLLRACALLAGCALLLATAGAAHAQMKLDDYAVGNYPLGGEFTLTNHDGGKTRLRDFRGKAVLMAFGYTHCPDVCPTTLSDFKLVKQALGAQGDRLQALFISVDPERDTPAHLKRYVGNFDPSFVGLTGDKTGIDKVTKQYMARYRLRESGSAAGYFVDHTVFMYLLDPQGKVRFLFTPDVKRDIVVQGVQELLNG